MFVKLLLNLISLLVPPEVSGQGLEVHDAGVSVVELHDLVLLVGQDDLRDGLIIHALTGSLTAIETSGDGRARVELLIRVLEPKGLVIHEIVRLVIVLRASLLVGARTVLVLSILLVRQGITLVAARVLALVPETLLQCFLQCLNIIEIFVLINLTQLFYLSL